MEITIYNRTNDSSCMEYLPLFQKIAKACEKKLHLAKDKEVSVTFVRSVTIHTLNREYRGIDRPTDVITFAAQDGDLIDNEEISQDLGDIFININYAKKQAREYGHSVKRETAFLFTHGLLHCLGYDHQNEEEEKEMFGLQEEILDPIVPRK